MDDNAEVGTVLVPLQAGESTVEAATAVQQGTAG